MFSMFFLAPEIGDRAQSVVGSRVGAAHPPSLRWVFIPVPDGSSATPQKEHADFYAQVRYIGGLGL